jgi:hypothetical protein
MWSMQRTLNLGTNSASALGPRKTTENFYRVGHSHDLPDANWLLASSPVLNTRALTLVPFCVAALLWKTFRSLFYRNVYVHIIWISNIPCTTLGEIMHAYMHWYECKNTYIYISTCDYLVIGNSEKRKGYYRKFVAHPITILYVTVQVVWSSVRCIVQISGW